MSLSEFQIIEQYFAQKQRSRTDIILGIGDDGATIRTPEDKELVISIDTLVAGVHFPNTTQAKDIAYKALAVNLSDLAAMGATPSWFTLALTLPEAAPDWLNDFSAGLFSLANEYDVQLVGGDLTHGPLSITIQIAGYVPNGQTLCRHGARAGDLIYVTGVLGDAALALQAEQGIVSVAADKYSYILGRLNCPVPRVTQGILLRGLASACIDISDGLMADLGHILTASDVGAVVNVANLPISSVIKSSISNEEQGLKLALCGGDDYELCFCIAPDKVGELEETLSDNDCPYTCIGEIKEAPSLDVVDTNGNSLNLECEGYNHFSS